MDRYLGKINNRDFYVDDTDVIWYRNPKDNMYTPCFQDKTGRYIAIPVNKNGSINDFNKDTASMDRGLTSEEYNQLKSKYPNTRDNLTDTSDPKKRNSYIDKNYDYKFLEDGYTFTNVDPNYSPGYRKFTGNTLQRKSNQTKGKEFGKDYTGGGGSISSDQNVDSNRWSFFDLLGLSRSNNPSGPGFFIPIVLKPDNPFGSSGNNDVSLEGKSLELPMEGGVAIQDSVSVRFDRRLDSNLPWNNLIGNFASKVGDIVGASNELKNGMMNFAMFSYDTRNLRKTLSLSFIIPVTMATKQVRIEDIRAYLSNLQGMVYPTSLTGLMYPPLMSLTIGGMYKRFFGFITEVSIEWGVQGEFIHLNNNQALDLDSVFPQVIKGQIKFENLFTYDWGSQLSGLSAEVSQYFTLKKDSLEGTLFGVNEDKSVDGMYDGIDYSKLRDELNKAEQKYAKADWFNEAWGRYINEYGWEDYFFEPFTVNDTNKKVS